MKTKKRPNAQQMLAAINRHNIESLRTLLAAGADPNATIQDDYHGKRPILQFAAGILFVEGVEAMLKAGADPNVPMTGGLGAEGGATALHMAVLGWDTRPGTNIKKSAEAEKITIVDMLLKAGANPNAVAAGSTLPLYEAARFATYEVCELLLKAGATVETWPPGCNAPLVGAPDRNKEDMREKIVRLFLKHGAPVDGESTNGSTALMAAAYWGSERFVNLFLELGANVNHRTKNGQSPLHSAAVFARDATTDYLREPALRIVKRLVEAGADPKAKNADGETAYDIACRFRTSPASEYLKNLK